MHQHSRFFAMFGSKGTSSDQTSSKPAPPSGCNTGGDTRNDGKVSFGYSLLQGKRASMEDFYRAEFTKDSKGNVVGLFGVFDGHGGQSAAHFVKTALFESLLTQPKFPSSVKDALIQAFVDTDQKYLQHDSGANRDDGCTAVTAVLVGQHLVVANVGDSRAILARGDDVIAMSVDHKPNREDERRRIERLGGVVVWAGTWRVGGVLAVSRAFGDRLLKPYVIPVPEVKEEALTSSDDIMIMASDGLWDVIANADAINLIKDVKDAEKAAKKLTDEAYSRGSNDNISCIVIRFKF